MNNLRALGRLCNAIVNTFYPDKATLEWMLWNEGTDPEADAQPKDAVIFRAAVALVKGYVETSRNENGLSTAINEDAVKRSLLFWCDYYDLDPETELQDFSRTVEDGSYLW